MSRLVLTAAGYYHYDGQPLVVFAPDEEDVQEYNQESKQVIDNRDRRRGFQRAFTDDGKEYYCEYGQPLVVSGSGEAHHRALGAYAKKGKLRRHQLHRQGPAEANKRRRRRSPSKGSKGSDEEDDQDQASAAEAAAAIALGLNPRQVQMTSFDDEDSD